MKETKKFKLSTILVATLVLVLAGVTCCLATDNASGEEEGVSPECLEFAKDPRGPR